ncbi:MAG: guanylate kinase [Planctomycetota bacterium]|jgi:guanylate kinase
MSSGLLFVISGPSGVGKTSIARAVEERLGGRFSVSATTRPKAAGEEDGRDYWFYDDETFRRMIDDGAFLEHAQVFGQHRYGTPAAPVRDALERGDLILLDIDVQGAAQIREAAPDALMLFILPPDDDELLRRLRNRGREGEAVIQRRFAEARAEIDAARTTGVYDALIVNADLATAIEDVCGRIQDRLGMRD